MTKVLHALNKISAIEFSADSPLVVKTVASEIVKRLNLNKEIIKAVNSPNNKQEGFQLSVGKEQSLDIPDDLPERYIYLKLSSDGKGIVNVSHKYYLYSFVTYVFDKLAENDVEIYIKGKIFEPAFDWQRISYDYFLAQQGRIQRGLSRESYMRSLAEFGFTHVEINGLGFPMSIESGPEGETYPMFYTYCPALDQFVYSKLNKGLYPYHYLSANLRYLKENAHLAKKYGISPGLLSFEPRSVPEQFFEKYPMLRGARIDHPFRSFKPRYNMTITHPKVLDHYREMIGKLMNEVPELEYMTIWTNDSGAGFEHTRSLYVGRNGGAYMIREWKDDNEISVLAGKNALRYFNTLKDEASKINPDFRIITRMESFFGEHETVWAGLKNKLEIETNSLVIKGWAMPYHHPKYPDSFEINGGSIYQQEFDKKETKLASDLETKGSAAHFYFSSGPHAMFEPLLGVPTPKLIYDRLRLLAKENVNYLSHYGGTFPLDLVPYNISHEIIRRFQMDSEMDIEKEIENIATTWAGKGLHSTLIKAWELAEKAIINFPVTTTLYTTFGFTWYRLWVRPLVPDIESIPQMSRDYYENYMCTTPHNPNNVDLSRDVLFQLTTPDKCKTNVKRIDANVWDSLDLAIQMLEQKEETAIEKSGNKNVITDQLVRLKALRCWFMTQRNVAEWVYCVYGYMDSENEDDKKQYRSLLREMINKEIENTGILIDLLNTEVEFMAITDKGETPLVHGDNISELLVKRIDLMKKHIDDEPFIDHNYIEKKAGLIIE